MLVRLRIGLINTLRGSRTGYAAEWLACQAPILHCRGSTPAEGVDKTDAKSNQQSTLDENKFCESKAM
ncbi:unnamed protein product [Protopolystoma xenopodis]|uniref:Uncharacterized protein n=1 Tax=Protopolystoma xenopodis TaxID=117903 RepID=A0A448WDF6_9PLAT|nr:unnamed protein product [Protopolystoma xenopodis]